jgi:penicillin-binding protein 1A
MLHQPDPLPRSGPWSPAGSPPAPTPTPPPVRRWRPSRRLVSILIALAALLFMVAVGWLAVNAPPSRTAQPVAPPSVSLLAADGSLLARRGAVTEPPVDASKLPPHVPQAFVAIEDRRFFSHHGLDFRGLARAAWHDLRARRFREGGSTITQQLAKQVYLNSDRTAARKLKEVLIAPWLEFWLTKNQILSRYLSDVYFGDNVYGLRAAARHYFGVPTERLTVAQAAMLAGLMKAPSRLAPSANLAGAQARAALVVDAMRQAGLITAAEAAAASPARLRLRPVPQPLGASYFADWVLPQVRQPGEPTGYRALSVRTTLDPRLQRLAEAAVARAPLGAAQAALVAMRPDGRVVAMVGGRHYDQSPFNRATQARRQPGSTFKLFVYLAALRAGMTPDDQVQDAPITIGNWSPRNSDNRYLGSITLREAFARSSNVAAARLAQRVGIGAVQQAARDLGVASPLGQDPGLALGTSGITLAELAAAYAGVAGGAVPVHPYGLPDMATVPPHPLDERTRAMLLDLLSATVDSGTARNAALNVPTYGKTGTSQDNRDALFVGFAGGLVTAVWVGRDDNGPLPGMAGGGLPARIWRNFTAPAIGARARPAAIRDDDVDPDAHEGGLDRFFHSVFRRIGHLFD